MQEDIQDLVNLMIWTFNLEDVLFPPEACMTDALKFFCTHFAGPCVNGIVVTPCRGFCEGIDYAKN